MKENLLGKLFAGNKGFFWFIIFVFGIGIYTHVTTPHSKSPTEQQRQYLKQLMLSGLVAEEEEEHFKVWNNDLYRVCQREAISNEQELHTCYKQYSQRELDWLKSH